MKYYIAFSASRSLIGRAIRWFRKIENDDAYVNHCFIIKSEKELESIEDIKECLDADWAGVRTFDFSKEYLKSKYYIEIWGFPNEAHKAQIAYNKQRKKVGQKYPKLQIVSNGLTLLMKKLGFKNKKPLFKKNDVCSELVARFLLDCIDNPIIAKAIKDIDINMIAPDQILDIFFASKDTSLISIKDYDDAYLDFLDCLTD